MSWRVIVLPEARLELTHEVATYGERLLDEVDAVREWLSSTLSTKPVGRW